MESYIKLFHERFDKSTEFDATFANIWNSQGLKDAIEYLKSIGATRLDTSNFSILYAISEFTKNTRSDVDKENLIKGLNLDDYVKDSDIKFNSKYNLPEVVVETEKGSIKALKFSDVVNGIKTVYPFIETNERFRNCFGMACYICLNLGLACNLVTGYVYGYSDKSEYLHSWIETTLHGEEVVIDGTFNAIINKDGYYLMRYAKPITKIDSKTFSNDVDKYLKVIENELPIEVYYVFRDEIIAELEKNKEVFMKR